MFGLPVGTGALVDAGGGGGAGVLVGAGGLLRPRVSLETPKNSYRESHGCLVPKTTPHATAMAAIAMRMRAARMKNHVFGMPQILPFRWGPASSDCDPATLTAYALFLVTSFSPSFSYTD